MINEGVVTQTQDGIRITMLSDEQLSAVAGGDKKKGAPMGVCPKCGNTMAYVGNTNGDADWKCDHCG